MHILIKSVKMRRVPPSVFEISGANVCSAAGKVDFAALVKSAEQCCGMWPREAAARQGRPAATAADAEKLCCLVYYKYLIETIC